MPVTTELRPIETFRVAVHPSAKNGLRAPSQIMVDKAHTIPRAKAGAPFGELEARALKQVDRTLAVFLGIG